MDDKNKLLDGYKEFLTATPVEPPREVTESILNYVRGDLATSHFQIFTKLILLHALASVVTLSVCPQFGISIFGNGIGLLTVFSKFGIYGCLTVCAALYVGVSFFLSSLILKSYEWDRLRKFGVLYSFGIGILSLLIFMLLGADIVFKYGAVWLMSATFAGLLTLQIRFAPIFARSA